MARTTASLVEGIVEVDEDIDLTPFIDTASLLVTRVCAPRYTEDADGGAEICELIERWLAAHFYKIRDQAVAAEKAGPASANYQYKVDLILSQTKEGQQAMLIDVSGALAALNEQLKKGNTNKPNAFWLGTCA